MTVATVGANGRPSARVVLLRQWDARGFVFYTNYESRKGAELTVHPHAALLFWWGALERQVRVEGATERILEVESDAYFATRPRGHRLSRVGLASERGRARPRDACSARWTTRTRAFPARFRGRRSGAAIASCRSASSSGRDGRTACTTASRTSAATTAGRSCGSRRKRLQSSRRRSRGIAVQPDPPKFILRNGREFGNLPLAVRFVGAAKKGTHRNELHHDRVSA